MPRVYKKVLTDKVTLCFTPEMLMDIERYRRRYEIADFSKAVRELVKNGLECGVGIKGG